MWNLPGIFQMWVDLYYKLSTPFLLCILLFTLSNSFIQMADCFELDFKLMHCCVLNAKNWSGCNTERWRIKLVVPELVCKMCFRHIKHSACRDDIGRKKVHISERFTPNGAMPRKNSIIVGNVHGHKRINKIVVATSLQRPFWDLISTFATQFNWNWYSSILEGPLYYLCFARYILFF